MSDTPTIKAPEPGIYEGVPDGDYRAWPLVSQSLLSMFRNQDVCELDIKDRLDGKEQFDNDAMQLGRLTEAAVDGLELAPNVKCLPPEIKMRKGPAWEELHREFPDVEFLPPAQFKEHNETLDVARNMAAAVHADPLAMKLLTGAKGRVAAWKAFLAAALGRSPANKTDLSFDEGVKLHDAVVEFASK